MSKFLLALTLSFSLSAFADSAAPTDPEHWYNTEYAPVWDIGVSDRLDKGASHYEAEILVQSENGSFSTVNYKDWIASLLILWAEEGWTGSQVTELSMQRINQTTASFKGKWFDHNISGAEEYSCGWYLAHWNNGEWRFVAFANLDCANM